MRKFLLTCSFLSFSLSSLASQTFLILSDHGKTENVRKILAKKGHEVLRTHNLSYADLLVVVKSNKSHFVNLSSELPGVIIEDNQDIEFEEFEVPKALGKRKSGSLFSQQWGMNNTGANAPEQDESSRPRQGIKDVDIRALLAWEVNDGNKDVVIAVMDTGMDINHSDLRDNLYVNDKEKKGLPGVDDDENGIVDDINGYDFGDNDSNVSDYHGHGTHVAGIIGASHNGSGVRGVMNRVRILPLKVFKDNNTLNAEGVVRALDYAVKAGAVVASNSWGGGAYSKIIERAIKEAGKADLLFVASSGNDNSNNDQTKKYPAGYPLGNIISVASHNQLEEKSYFSNYGKETVHLLAPGHFIVSSFPGNTHKVWSGTSMAAPYVSGAIGLLISQEGKMSFKEVKERLLATTTPHFNYYEKVKSMGRLNLYNLLKEIRPDRGLPKEEDWIDLKIDTPLILSSLPKNFNKSYKWKAPGAKFIRLLIKQYDLRGDSFANIRDPKKRSEFHHISGLGKFFATKFIKSDEIGIRISSGLNSSGSIQIEKIQYTKD